MTDETDTSNALVLAEAKLAELQSRLDRAREQVTANRSRAHENAFDAEARDSTEAKRLSTKLIDDSRKLEDDIEHRLEPAVSEAGRRVKAAQAAVADDVELANAAKALERLETFAKRGAALDAKFDEAIAEYQRLTQDFGELERLNFAPTTFDLVRVNMRAAATTKLMFTDLRQEFLAPHERRNFVTVIEAWSAAVRGKATARLNRGKPAEKHGKAA